MQKLVLARNHQALGIFILNKPSLSSELSYQNLRATTRTKLPRSPPMALQLRLKYRAITSPSLLHLRPFSSSSSSAPEPSPEEPTNDSSQSPRPSISSYLSDIKSSLNDRENPNNDPSPSSTSPMSSYLSDVKSSLNKQPSPPKPLRQNPNNYSFPSSNSSISSFLSDVNAGVNEQPPPPNPSATEPGDDSSAPPRSSFSSYFSDVKSSLKQEPSSLKSLRTAPPSSSSALPRKAASLEEIRQNLSKFSLRSKAPQSDEPSYSSSFPSSESQPISFQQLYKNVAKRKEDESKGSTGSGWGMSFDSIRGSLRKQTDTGSMRDGFRLKPVESKVDSKIIGGSEALPLSVFGKEQGERKDKDGKSKAFNTEFIKMYTYQELGTKLKNLKSQTAEEGEFSLSELNDRLAKLREMEEKEAESKIGGLAYTDLRSSLVNLRMSEEEQVKKSPVSKLNVLGGIGQTPDYTKGPPKEHLVEMYNHPDNMSAAEKLKLELQKVREEFKMSESDCGSTRVQVAQLTVKIKHLSSVLHKKDKHSRRGLVAMVHQRKRLLKYLRRTDWESYCMVLTKLGLRDNPDYKL